MLRRLSVGFINLFVVLAELFLALRFLLRFLDANPLNQFVNWVYSSSNYLLQPFRGMFSLGVVGHHHVVEFSTLFAMAVYAVVGLVLVWFVRLLAPRKAK